MTTQVTTPINISEAGDKSVGTGPFDVVALTSASKLPAGIYNSGDGLSTTTKAADTLYQNTSGYTKVVTLTMTFSCQNTGGQYVYLDAFIGTTSSPDKLVSRTGITGSAASTPTISGTITLIVPNNYYYKFVSAVAGFSSFTVNSSFECYLV